jgi:hypothetical protein
MSVQALRSRTNQLIAALLLIGALATVGAPGNLLAQDNAASPISPSAPQTYTVKQGDTLWSIATLFLRDPWLWPEIWYVNPQVRNPHLIYPGDVLALSYGKDGKPIITLQTAGAMRLSPQVRSQPLQGAIYAIPYDIVAAFVSKPTVLSKEEIKAAPYALSSREQHLIAATGNTIYARGKLSDQAGTNYNLINVGAPLRDPDDNDVVGYIGHYTGAAKLTRGGDPATLEISDSKRETLEGDKLFPAEISMNLDFIPHAPEKPVDGRVISLVNGISMAGQYQVVVINRGKQHGVEPGQVLNVYQAGQKVRDRSVSGLKKSSRVQLPDERSGTFMVFKSFDRISYGLIMHAVSPIREKDRVGNP